MVALPPAPISSPTHIPTKITTANPTAAPTSSKPTVEPSTQSFATNINHTTTQLTNTSDTTFINSPTRIPTKIPTSTHKPSEMPTSKPTGPTRKPTQIPTRQPSVKQAAKPNTLTIAGDNGTPAQNFPLGMCEGDCDKHDDCAPGLMCFHRSDITEVYGCEGLGVSGKDYCFDPNQTMPPTSQQPTMELTLIEFDSRIDSGAGDTPTQQPTKETTFVRGDLLKYVPRLGIKVCSGMNVRMLAKSDQPVDLIGGRSSDLKFHGMPDGAAIFPLSDGYVYVSNSEMKNSKGGVYGVYFNHDGKILDYKMLLTNTKRNCSGGSTPWNTWVSCEEHGSGQCWQVDPDPSGEHHLKPEMTKLGGDGGNFESVVSSSMHELNNLLLGIFLHLLDFTMIGTFLRFV